MHKVKTTSLNAMCENYDLPTNPFKGKLLFSAGVIVWGWIVAIPTLYTPSVDQSCYMS